MGQPDVAGARSAALAPERSRITSWVAGMHRQPAAHVLIISLLWLGAVALADTLSPPQFSFSIFYLLAVVRVSATGRRGYLVPAAALTAVTWSAIESLSLALEQPWLPLLWNVAARFAVLCFTGLLVVAVVGSASFERERSHTDPLTGLYNRRGFNERAELELARAARRDAPVSALFLDVDGFKPVNDHQGHAAGDRLLGQIARTLQSGLRGYDLVARVGGDEFAALLPGASSAVALAVAQRAADDLDTMCRQEGWPVTFSVGAATFVSTVTQPGDVLAGADRLMYAAKRQRGRSGRSTVVGGVVDDTAATR